MKQSLQLRLGQQLTMTPQLQQAIRLLQLSTLDLKQEIQEALDSNLMLESEEEAALAESIGRRAAGRQRRTATSPGNGEDRDRDQDREVNGGCARDPRRSAGGQRLGRHLRRLFGAGPSQREDGDVDFLAFRSSAATLHDHLLWQLNLTPFGPTDRAIATTIIDSISEDGYLTSDLEEIHAALDDETISLEEVEAVLHRIQNFDPAGVGARGPQECLLLQLRQLPQDTPYLAQAIRLCDELFDLLAARDQTQIKRRLKVVGRRAAGASPS